MTLEISPEGIPHPGPPNSTWSTCTVDGCTWAIRTDHENLPPSVLASVFGLGVMSQVALNAHLTEIEEAIAKHCTTHTDVEYLQTISRLMGRVAELEEGEL